ncbi:MAG: LTA synthase family protein [Succinivibrionaceae bacterium]
MKVYKLLKKDLFLLFIILVIQLLSRLVLCIIYNNYFDGFLITNPDFFYIILQGVRVDILTACWFFGPLMAFNILFSNIRYIGTIWNVIHHTLVSIYAFIAISMELLTPNFVEEYGFRPNRLFYEFLLYPKQVLSMLYESHLISFVFLPFIFFGLIFSIIKFWRSSVFVIPESVHFSFLSRVVLFLIWSTLVFIGARSSFEHRPFNPSMVAFSEKQLLNELPINSTYSVVYSVKKLLDTKSYNIYPSINKDEAFDTVATSLNLPKDTLWHKTEPVSSINTNKNIVIILEESLSGKFVNAIDSSANIRLTPNLNKLYEEGYGFYNMFSTGIRSVRGIEATTSCFPPTINTAVVKREKGQQGLFNIAQVFSGMNYDTSFIYGGEKHFDNMSTFFLGNGYKTIIDEKDYKDPKYWQSWGASDIDLFDKAHEYFTKHQRNNKPFYSLIFSSSNHTPYDVPELPDLLYIDPPKTNTRGVQFADYALGYFFEKAKKSNYWDNTIFLIISDHNDRTSADQLLPIDNFHIPALILGKDITPKKEFRLASQLDIVPTLLSIVGIDTFIPCLGVDLNKANYNRDGIVLQYNYVFGFLKNDGNVVIIQPESESRYIHKTYSFNERKYIDNSIKAHGSSDKKLEKIALAFAHIGEMIYQNESYKMLKSPNK